MNGKKFHFSFSKKLKIVFVKNTLISFFRNRKARRLTGWKFYIIAGSHDTRPPTFITPVCKYCFWHDMVVWNFKSSIIWCVSYLRTKLLLLSPSFQHLCQIKSTRTKQNYTRLSNKNKVYNRDFICDGQVLCKTAVAKN